MIKYTQCPFCTTSDITDDGKCFYCGDISKRFMEIKCDSCEEKLATFHQEVRGFLQLVCPKCENTSVWQSVESGKKSK